ncbi:hypothetical protein KAT45_01770 [Candidatus Aerophobetes bacterium]|nr:hypothetical protein [Candidatus Aerophobetes bacterium]
MKGDKKMGGFEELGKKLDKLAEKTRSRTQEGVEKTRAEAKNWGEKIDKLGEKIKKTTQEGIEKFALETKEIGQVAKLRSEVRQRKKEMESFLKELGEKTYQLHLEKKIGNVELKKLGSKITKLKKGIESKEKDIQRLRER